MEKEGKVVFEETGNYHLVSDGKKQKIYVINGFLSILPPLLAIILALVFRQVILSLFLGIYIGIFIKNQFHFMPALMETLADTIPESIATKDHISIILFSLLLGGMVGIISSNGGTDAIVRAVTGKITNRKSRGYTNFGA